MKFMVAKKDVKCYGCEALIERDQKMVLTFMKTPTFKKVFTYHAACYPIWFQNMYQQKLQNWLMGGTATPWKHRGRPLTVTQNKEEQLNRLRSNMSYHKKLGHEAKVLGIKKKIESILLGNTGSTNLMGNTEVEDNSNGEVEEDNG